MSRNVTSADMLARVRYETDTENDTHVSDVEIYKHLTSAVSDTWDKILAYGIGDEGIKKATFNAVSGQIEYPLTDSIWTVAPASAAALTDFYKLKTLYVNDGTGLYRPISRVNPNEQYALTGPTSSVSMKLYYFPVAPTFTTGSETFDGINGWEDHAIQGACVKVKKKKEDDAGQYKSSMREIEQRMKVHANRNADEPPRVIRRRANQEWARKIAPYSGGVYAWDKRGGNIELYAPSIGLYL